MTDGVDGVIGIHSLGGSGSLARGYTLPYTRSLGNARRGEKTWRGYKSSCGFAVPERKAKLNVNENYSPLSEAGNS